MDLDLLSYEQVENRVGRIMDAYVTNLATVLTNGVFRARRNRTDELFTHVRELWYPPAANVVRDGRINKAGESVFYASNTLHTAIFELRPAIGSVYTVLVCRPNGQGVADLKVGHIGLERSQAPELHQLLKQDHLRSNPAHISSLGMGNYRKWLMIDDYLGDVFSQRIEVGEEYKYKPTIAISSILFNIPDISGINYLSIETSLKGINLCLKPEIVDRHFAPSEAVMLRIERTSTANEIGINASDDLLYQISFTRKSTDISPEGIIRWSDQVDNLDINDIGHLLTRGRSQ